MTFFIMWMNASELRPFNSQILSGMHFLFDQQADRFNTKPHDYLHTHKYANAMIYPVHSSDVSTLPHLG